MNKLVLFLLIITFQNAFCQNDNVKSATKPIKLAPLFLGPPTPEYPSTGEMTKEKLANVLDNMKEDGIEEVLFMGGWKDKIYYPSRILKEPSSIDWYKIAFEMTLKRKMKVILPGVHYTYNDQFLDGTWNPYKDLEINKKIYTELNERYGHYSNFWGWYIPHETGDRTHRGDIMVVLESLPKFLKKLTPNKKVVYAPWFPSRITIGKEGLTPTETAKEWDAMLSKIEGIDIFIFQDGTAPLDELESYFAAIKPVFDKHNVELSAVLELFFRYQDGSGIELFKSISPDLLFGKMKIISPYIERFAIWDYQTHLYPKSKAPGAKELNRAYRNCLKL